jgi:hypothetical protein
MIFFRPTVPVISPKGAESSSGWPVDCLAKVLIGKKIFHTPTGYIFYFNSFRINKSTSKSRPKMVDFGGEGRRFQQYAATAIAEGPSLTPYF